MKIAVVGLGLIGGSMAKAIKKYTNHTVVGFDADKTVEEQATDDGAIDGPFSEPFDFDLMMIALYPKDAVEYLKENAGKIPTGAVVMDCCGVKSMVCAAGEKYAAQYGFYFVGGHPMAGVEKSGFSASNADLFHGASMLLVANEQTPAKIMEMLQELFLSLDFKIIKQTTAAEHDRMIAYTSQLAHIVSSSYIKSPTAQNYMGFSAGSFKDMTRVAFLNESMWSELFLENRENLIDEIDQIVERLLEYRSALKNGEKDTLYRLLGEGKAAKISSDRIGGAKI